MTLLNRSFRSIPSCVEFGPGTMEKVLKESVWVDGAGLRSIFKCLPQMDEDLLHLILRKDLICHHKIGLQPRIARCGKLVPRQFYEELIELIETEQHFSGSTSPASSSKDCFISSHVACDQCAEPYKLELQTKLELLKSFRIMYHELDPSSEGTQAESDSSDYVYAVSKRFITKFRKTIAALLKKLETFDATPGGLDDLEDWQVWNASTSLDDIDTTVNSAIVCKLLRWQIDFRLEIFSNSPSSQVTAENAVQSINEMSVMYRTAFGIPYTFCFRKLSKLRNRNHKKWFGYDAQSVRGQTKRGRRSMIGRHLYPREYPAKF